MPRAIACLYLACAMIMTGANVPIGKVLVEGVSIYAFAFVRFVIASILLAALDSRETGTKLSDLTGRDWLDVVAMTLLGMVLYTVFILEGVKRTSGVDAGIILATLPAIVAIMGAVFLRERPGMFQLAAILLSVAGIALILSHGAVAKTEPASSLLGNGLVGAAVVCEACFVLLSRRLSRVLSPMRLAFAGSLVAGVLSMPLALASGDLGRLGDVPLFTWGLATWYMLSASILSLWFWYRGVGHVETWMAGICTACLPCSALAISVVFLGETVSSAQIAGAVCVVVAILVGSVVPSTKRV
jgi:drug/metabolite transporter (DMT)-like permease